MLSAYRVNHICPCMEPFSTDAYLTSYIFYTIQNSLSCTFFVLSHSYFSLRRIQKSGSGVDNYNQRDTVGNITYESAVENPGAKLFVHIIHGECTCNRFTRSRIFRRLNNAQQIFRQLRIPGHKAYCPGRV